MSKYIRRIKKPEKHLAPRLGRLDIELTERCNNNCIHCCINLPENDREAKAREMTTGQIEAILGEAADLGCLQVRFTGGEPLLRSDFEYLYLFARRLGLKVLLFTNARLLTPHLASLFARTPPLEKIEITVYGMQADSYESVSRKPGSYDQFMQGINLLLEYKIPFTVKYALLPPNRHELEEFEAWAQSLPWTTRPPGYSMFLDLRNRCDDADKNRLITSLRISPGDGVAVLTRNAKVYRKDMKEFALKFMGPPGDALFNCGAGEAPCIDAYGYAQPCLGLRSPELKVCVLGKKNPSSLNDALDRYSKLYELRAENPEYSRRCAVCFIKSLCEQCPAKSWAEHGTLDTPVEYFCEAAHAQARWLGWLDKEEKAWTVKNWKERI
ncbi:MAG: radical SAM protein [Candidatus Aminicenantes bacterium]